MKLLNKTSLIILTVTLFIFFLGGIAFYRIIESMIIKRIDRELLSDQQDIVSQMKTAPATDHFLLLTSGKVQVEPADPNFFLEKQFRDTVLYNTRENLFSPFRVLQFSSVINEKNYRILVFRSRVEAESLIEQIVLTMMIMLFSFILALFFLNRYFFQKIWDDFFLTLNKVRKYNLHDDPHLNLPESEVEEFQILNEVLAKLTERIHKDYQSLKEFTENASHEIQTPLSVMHSKIELLLQDPKNSEEQVIQISKLNDAVNRLSNINKVLILLTRIENNQFPELSIIRLKERVEYHLENFKELIETRDITVTVELNEKIEIYANSGLTDILIINILKNAIRYNFDHGTLNIYLGNDSLVIMNSGPKHNLSSAELFSRFVRTRRNSDSLGLGLSIVKRICELYGFDVYYSAKDELHTLTVRFNLQPL